MDAAVVKQAQTAEITSRKAAAEVVMPHRLVYGFYLRNNALDGYGVVSTYLDQLDRCDMVYSFTDTDNEAVYAGAAVDDIWYGIGYKFLMTGPPEVGYFMKINLKTGERTNITKWDDGDEYGWRAQDMTYNYADKKMYCIGFEMGISALYEVNLETAEFTKVCEFKYNGVAKTLGTVAADYNGNMYGIAHDGVLYSIDKATGNLTAVLETGLVSMPGNQTMEFDHTTGLLYWASCTNSKTEGNHSFMIRIDVKNKTVEDGDIQMGMDSSFEGMYIPFVLAGEKAPAAPTDFTVVAGEQGAKTATLAWKAPVKTFGGDALNDVTKITVTRNKEVIKTMDVTEQGQAMTFTDENVPTDGEFRYEVYATNAVGEGERAVVYRYVGLDVPQAVGNIQVKPTEGCAGAVITWEKPAGGIHNGYYGDSNVKYSVTRLPGETLIAKGLEEPTFTDNGIRRLAKYNYKITVENSIGATDAYSAAAIYGPALDMPVMETLDNNQAFLNKWTTVDANGDYYTWMINTGMDVYEFGFRAIALEYIINPTFVPGLVYVDADEWVITPPLNFEEGKEYQIMFETRNITDEKLEVYTGKTNVYGDMTLQKDMTLATCPIDESGNTNFVTNIVDLPAMAGVNFVGLRLCSPIPPLIDPSQPYREPTYFQMTNFVVGEKGSVGISEANNVSDISVDMNEGSIEIMGEFDMATLYNAAGKQVGATTGAQLLTGSLNSGVYVLTVKKGTSTKVFKLGVR